MGKHHQQCIAAQSCWDLVSGDELPSVTRCPPDTLGTVQWRDCLRERRREWVLRHQHTVAGVIKAIRGYYFTERAGIENGRWQNTQACGRPVEPCWRPAEPCGRPMEPCGSLSGGQWRLVGALQEARRDLWKPCRSLVGGQWKLCMELGRALLWCVVNLQWQNPHRCFE